MSKRNKIPPAYFRMIEFELYNYDETKRQIEELKDEIIDTPPMPLDEQVGGKSGISNPTEKKAITLTSNIAIARMEKTIRAIDRALILLDESHNEIFELRYRQGKNWRQVLAEACFGQDTYFRKRKELIHMVALQLGLANM